MDFTLKNCSPHHNFLTRLNNIRFSAHICLFDIFYDSELKNREQVLAGPYNRFLFRLKSAESKNNIQNTEFSLIL